MSRGNDTRDRRDRRHRDDRYRELRDPYPPTARGPAFPQDYPPEYNPPVYDEPAVPEPGYEPRPPRRADNDTTSRRRGGGLNDDYYNAPSDSHDSSSRRRSSRRNRNPDRHSRRSEERYDSHRYSKPTPETEDEDDYYQPKPRRRATTAGPGRGRSSKRYDTDYTDEEPEARPAKPNRGKSFLNAIGIGKADKHVERERERDRRRGRSPAARSSSRSGRRDYSHSPSPTRRRRSAHSASYGKHGGRATGGASGLVAGLKRSNTNWQRVAGSAVKAGATAAYELRNDPSPWVGPKGIKVATAALGAAVADSLMEGKHPKKTGGMRHNTARQLSEVALRHIVSGGSSGGRSRGRH